MQVTVLSPHADDATFSLALALRRWSDAGAGINILNFFTWSAYAPFAGPATDIPRLRAREDRRAMKIVSGEIEIQSLELFDAPRRLGIDFGSITNSEAFTPRGDEVAALARRIRRLFAKSLVLAPLGLGGHIDHRTVHQAAIAAAVGHGLGFYEDLPYASWTEESAIRSRVSGAELELRTPLMPSVQRSRGWRFKARVAGEYRSQIDDFIKTAIARYGEKYKGAERIWVPRHSARWRTFLHLL